MRGTAPPVITSEKAKPSPRGCGLISTTTSPNCHARRFVRMTAPDLDALADCLLVANVAFLCFGLDAEAAIEPFKSDAQVHFALAPKNHLV